MSNLTPTMPIETKKQIRLFRGVRNLSEKELIITNKTAGGKEPNPYPRRPDPKDPELVAQIGTKGECFPPEPTKTILTKFTEYTIDESKARSFASRSGFMVEIIADEDLTCLGSTAEKGIMLYSDTPIQLIKVHTVTKIGISSGFGSGSGYRPGFGSGFGSSPSPTGPRAKK